MRTQKLAPRLASHFIDTLSIITERCLAKSITFCCIWNSASFSHYRSTQLRRVRWTKGSRRVVIRSVVDSYRCWKGGCGWLCPLSIPRRHRLIYASCLDRGSSISWVLWVSHNRREVSALSDDRTTGVCAWIIDWTQANRRRFKWSIFRQNDAPLST